MQKFVHSLPELTRLTRVSYLRRNERSVEVIVGELERDHDSRLISGNNDIII